MKTIYKRLTNTLQIYKMIFFPSVFSGTYENNVGMSSDFKVLFTPLIKKNKSLSKCSEHTHECCVGVKSFLHKLFLHFESNNGFLKGNQWKDIFFSMQSIFDELLLHPFYRKIFSFLLEQN